MTRGGDDPLLPQLRAHLASADRVDIAAAFVLERGLAEIDERLNDVVRRPGARDLSPNPPDRRARPRTPERAAERGLRRVREPIEKRYPAR